MDTYPLFDYNRFSLVGEGYIISDEFLKKPRSCKTFMLVTQNK